MKREIFLMVIIVMVVGSLFGCVAKDPLHDVIIQEVKDGLQVEYSEDLAKIDKIIIFENTMKIYMVDDYKPTEFKKFAKESAKQFGLMMRKNKKLESTYHLQIFQKKKIDDKKVVKQIAECLFENGSDRVTFKDLGLGDGKYDVY